MTAIGIAEDQALIRESLAIVLSMQPDIQVTWQVANGKEAVDCAARQPVDVILMDLRLPEIDGVMATRQIRSRHQDTLILILTTFHHDEWLIDALNAGASACFLKEVPPDLLLQAIRAIVKGRWDPEKWTPQWRMYAPEIQFGMKINLPNNGLSTLTPREYDMLRLICKGSSNAQIAAELYLSEGTVKNYISSLYGKLGVRHRGEAIQTARSLGIH
ncbi:response regulator transcription factor [Cohnella lubricantis]|uniref:Response regulator transcription factor n=1 Tax=Cohnella lubricantis TaxID=2163172 RepID=A0A841TBQ2_9BACL|nr:response regulator transcription factor [Cohnella lubricantis]MBB6677455.1 response regulator transcription factor [Cohnella lubricantis]MBP2116659.1 DNA-binding NarL/FixJ family response regulator [Cohnella lubricantis]